jgi:hypothetical protein
MIKIEIIVFNTFNYTIANPITMYLWYLRSAKGAKSKRALSADHANRRIWSDRSGITPKKSNNNSSSKDNNSNNSSNIAKKLKFSPSRNNNQDTSTKMRDIRSRGASRGIEIRLVTFFLWFSTAF